jgi:hypothetical protein
LVFAIAFCVKDHRESREFLGIDMMMMSQINSPVTIQSGKSSQYFCQCSSSRHELLLSPPALSLRLGLFSGANRPIAEHGAFSGLTICDETVMGEM